MAIFLPTILIPTSSSELVTFCRVYLLVTAFAMLSGYENLGCVTSAMSVCTLFEEDASSYASSKRIDATLLERWFMLCSLTTFASISSWFLMLVSTIQRDSDQAYRTFFFGYVLQKLWASGLGYILIKDLRFEFGFSQQEEEDRTIEGAVYNSTRRINNTSTQKMMRRQSSSLALQWHELRVRVIKGRDLVPMDHAFLFFGKMVTSDPYVEVLLGQNSLGTTPYVRKTLNPKWPEKSNTFRMAVLPKSLEVWKEVECRIFDYDANSSDDVMGTVMVRIPTTLNTPVRKWYPVGTGSGDLYCKEASGELMVEVEVICRWWRSPGVQEWLTIHATEPPCLLKTRIRPMVVMLRLLLPLS